MSFLVKEIADKEFQEGFLQKVAHTPFLQSFVWGEFQEKIGNKAHRFGVFEGEKISGIVSAYQIKTKFASYLYVPWGPVLSVWNKKLVEEIAGKLLGMAKRGNLDFIRLEPRVIEKVGVVTLKNLGFKERHSFTQPECTALIYLTKNEEELLSAMSDSTRYNVRMVERKGVRVRVGGLADLGTFEKLLSETAARQGFTTDIHRDYYKSQYEVLHKGKMMDIFVAEYEREPLAVSMVVFYGDSATYLHAASSRAKPKLRATYLLAWKSMLEAKKRGFRYFDFWGVAPENTGDNHPWSGVTSFKMSFGGERVGYIPVFDLPTSNKYLFSKFIELARKPAKRIFKLSF